MALNDTAWTDIATTASGDEELPSFATNQLLLIAIRLCIGVSGIIGNLLVCIVVARLWSTNKRNTTNTLIANQALIDLCASILLVGLTITELAEVSPPENYFLGQIFCKFWSSRFCLFAAYAASTFNLTEISMERYLAVIHPIYYSRKFANTTIAKALPIIPWLVGPFWQFIIAVLRYDFIPETVPATCTYEAALYTSAMEKIFGILVFLWDYFIPMIIMTFSFVKIFLRFRQQNIKVANQPPPQRASQGANVISTNSTGQDGASLVTAGDASQPGSSTQPANTKGTKSSGNIQRKNVTKTLFTVYVFYVICWSPDQWAFLQYNLGGSLDFFSSFINFAILSAQLNSCVNPFIYGLQYRHYRKGLVKLLRCGR
ncbi:trace amine-associated receptor 9-like [Asterias amurensis]|uniref:trace amine-associated receptor 9-like n=1 Tax=Asterias amurensis TaxID=7602 RepID=UPI003AB65D15